MNSFKDRFNWKQLFYILGTINIVILACLLIFFFWPSPTVNKPEVSKPDADDSSEFIVRTTKNNLNDLVNAYLDELLKDTNHQYSVSLEDDVHLLGELPIFSTTVPLSIHLEPFVEDGNLVLEQKSISVGLLKLPNRKIMEYIKKYLPMPEWVIVNPKEEEIYVAISEMDIKSNFRVSVEHFDLEANNLSFKINVPYKTLGIEKIEEE